MEYGKLYKRTATGAVQVWWGEVDDDRFRTHSGQLGGVITTSEWTVTTPKNVGRSNATTAEQQAHVEMEALYTKKQDQGAYHSNIDDIDTSKYFKPMLAQPIEKIKSITYPVTSQPKLDGVRCIATKEGLWSRTGKPLVATPHIEESLAPLFEVFPDLILDGELYNHSLHDDFNEIISLVRKTKPTAVDLEMSRSIQYHVYDCFDEELNYDARALFLSSILPIDSFIQLVRTDMGVPSKGDLDRLHSLYVEQGYEGQIVRLNGPYENKRSKYLIKRKDFFTEEFKIVQINEGKGNRSGMAGFITYELPDGRTFDSGLRGTWKESADLLFHADEYAGGMGTVRFFDYTPDGIPRFPVTIAVFKRGRDL